MQSITMELSTMTQTSLNRNVLTQSRLMILKKVEFFFHLAMGHGGALVIFIGMHNFNKKFHGENNA